MKKGNQRERTFTAKVYTFWHHYFYLLFFIILGLSFLLLQPSVSARLLPVKRSFLLSRFIFQVQNQGQLDPRQFWQLREFYSPGTFTFNPDKIGVFQTLRIISVDETQTPFLTFSAPHTFSQEYLVSDPSYFQQQISRISHPLFQNEQAIIFNDSAAVHMLFYTSIDEMKLANGFFDYLPSEMELLKGKYWLVEAQFKVE